MKSKAIYSFIFWHCKQVKPKHRENLSVIVALSFNNTPNKGHYIYIYIYSPDEPFYYNLHVLKISYNGYQVCKIIFFRCKWTLKGRICFPFSSKYKSLCTSRDVTKSYIHIYGCTSISKFAIWKACACIHEDLCMAV